MRWINNLVIWYKNFFIKHPPIYGLALLWSTFLAVFFIDWYMEEFHYYFWSDFKTHIYNLISRPLAYIYNWYYAHIGVYIHTFMDKFFFTPFDKFLNSWGFFVFISFLETFIYEPVNQFLEKYWTNGIVYFLKIWYQEPLANFVENYICRFCRWLFNNCVRRCVEYIWENYIPDFIKPFYTKYVRKFIDYLRQKFK